VKITSPIVIRIDGTNADVGREILKAHASDHLISRPTMLEAARTAVELANTSQPVAAR
jgi:succinyl-CoA synthetase beta subunit